MGLLRAYAANSRVDYCYFVFLRPFGALLLQGLPCCPGRAVRSEAGQSWLAQTGMDGGGGYAHVRA